MLATFKFMFAGVVGAQSGIPFWETVIATACGGIVSSAFFYFLSGWVISIQEKRRKRKDKLKGKPKRKFTRTNKWVIRIKQTFGLWGLAYIAPLVLTVPFGSILCAKFYGDNKLTFPLMVIFLCFNAIIMSFIWYAIF